MSNATYTEIADSFALWAEYVDPSATMTEAEFDAMDVDDRMAIIETCFGAETDDRD